MVPGPTGEPGRILSTPEKVRPAASAKQLSQWTVRGDCELRVLVRGKGTSGKYGRLTDIGLFALQTHQNKIGPSAARMGSRAETFPMLPRVSQSR
jgi:hypothetical protein